MTRAKRAADRQRRGQAGGVAVVGGGPIAWLGPALLGDIDAAVEQGSGVTELGVRFEFLREDDRQTQVVPIYAAQTASVESGDLLPAPEPPPPAEPAPPVAALSYSSLGEYKRCGYRFYVERVLGLPPVDRPDGPREAVAGLAPTDRGVLVHDLLERLDFRRPVKPTAAMISAAAQRTGIGSRLTDADAAEAADLVERFAATELCARLGRATQVSREERFAFLLGGGARGGGARRARARARRTLAGRRLQDRSARRRGSARGGRSGLYDAAARVRAGGAARRRRPGRGRARVPGRRARAGYRDVLARGCARAGGPAFGAGRRRHAARSSPSPTRRIAPSVRAARRKAGCAHGRWA